MTGRFRPLGAPGESRDPAPPEFGAAPWGYRRAEVDAWASWVAGLVAQGRNETVRADSAEATLRATLDRLERLERSTTDTAPRDTGELPRRGAPEPDSARAFDAEPRPAGPAFEAEPRAAAGPTAADERQPAPDPSHRHGGARGADREAARLQVVETALWEIMRLLHRLAGPERPGP